MTGPRPLRPLQLPLVGQKDEGTMCSPPLPLSSKARWGLLQLRPSYRPLSDLPRAQGIPLAASQTLSLSEAFFPDKRPVWASLGDLFEPPVGECEGRNGIF